MNILELKDPEDVRLSNIVDMGLTFSAMIRLYRKGSKRVLHKKIVSVLPEIADSESLKDFKGKHHEFCIWGTNQLSLAKKQHQDIIIKPTRPPSYGQVAKTLDVVLKVVVYYSRWPNELTSKRLSKWINPAIDTKMMAFLKSKYPGYLGYWPLTIADVNQSIYLSLQELVRRFIADEHQGKIMPVQFDDLYWNILNR